MDIVLVAARARNGVIGLEGRMPWHLPEELAHFKRLTLGHPVLMGRKTHESIGRPLPGRRNIVLTRDPHWRSPGVESASSLQQALQMVRAQEPSPTQACVIGGAEIYAQALPLANVMHLTEVDLDPHGDAFFPAFDDSEWPVTEQATLRSANGIGYTVTRRDRDLRRSRP